MHLIGDPERAETTTSSSASSKLCLRLVKLGEVHLPYPAVNRFVTLQQALTVQENMPVHSSSAAQALETASIVHLILSV